MLCGYIIYTVPIYILYTYICHVYTSYVCTWCNIDYILGIVQPLQQGIITVNKGPLPTKIVTNIIVYHYYQGSDRLHSEILPKSMYVAYQHTSQSTTAAAELFFQRLPRRLYFFAMLVHHEPLIRKLRLIVLRCSLPKANENHSSKSQNSQQR